LSPLRSRLLFALSIVTMVGLVVAAGSVVRRQRSDRDRREAERALGAALARTDGHRQHAGLGDVVCASCHRVGLPAAESCTGACHKGAKLHAHRPDADSCLSCHHFVRPADGQKPPTAVACAGCHARGDLPTKVVGAESLHGQLDCKLCHEPHGKIDDWAMRDCSRCHDLGAQPLTGPEGHRVCSNCHAEHGPTNQALASCATCHE
jgi:hypothetical protein